MLLAPCIFKSAGRANKWNETATETGLPGKPKTIFFSELREYSRFARMHRNFFHQDLGAEAAGARV